MKLTRTVQNSRKDLPQSKFGSTRCSGFFFFLEVNKQGSVTRGVSKVVNPKNPDFGAGRKRVLCSKSANQKKERNPIDDSS